MENMFHDISLERTVEIYRMLGDMGFGREIVGVFKKKQTDVESANLFERMRVCTFFMLNKQPEIKGMYVKIAGTVQRKCYNRKRADVRAGHKRE